METIELLLLLLGIIFAFIAALPVIISWFNKIKISVERGKKGEIFGIIQNNLQNVVHFQSCNLILNDGKIIPLNDDRETGFFNGDQSYNNLPGHIESNGGLARYYIDGNRISAIKIQFIFNSKIITKKIDRNNKNLLQKIRHFVHQKK